MAKRGGGGKHDAAVLIGIDDYPFLTPVAGAEANILAWERWLIDGRKVPYRKVQVLRGKGVGKRQVREAIEAAAAKVGAKGTLYLVFAGHGAPTDRAGSRAEPHLLLGNTQANHESFAETGVAVQSELSAWLAPAAQKGAKVVAVLDACFTGKGQGGESLIEGGQFAALSSLAAPAKVTLLTAASGKDITGPLPGASRPAFSYLVLAALRGWGDENHDGTVTAQEAVDFAAQVMREAQRPERPALSGKDVALARSGGEAVPAYRQWLGRLAPAATAPRRRVTSGSREAPGAEAAYGSADHVAHDPMDPAEWGGSLDDPGTPSDPSARNGGDDPDGAQGRGHDGSQEWRRVNLAVSLGTGGGSITEKAQAETLRDKRISPGFALTPFHSLFEADLWFQERLGIGAFARLQVVEPAALAGVRFKFKAFTANEHSLILRAGAGVGYVRHLVDLGVGLDTTSEGPYLYTLGVTYAYRLTPRFDLVFTPDFLHLIGDSPSLQFDLQLGIQTGF